MNDNYKRSGKPDLFSFLFFMDKDTKKGCLFSIIIFIPLFLLSYMIDRCSHKHDINNLEEDGFSIIETHKTYFLVEKDSNIFMATPTRDGKWNFEHYKK